MDIAQDMLTTFKDDRNLLKEVITSYESWMGGHGCMAMTLKPKSKHPNGSVQKSQDRKNHAQYADISVLYLRGVTLKGTR